MVPHILGNVHDWTRHELDPQIPDLLSQPLTAPVFSVGYGCIELGPACPFFTILVRRIGNHFDRWKFFVLAAYHAIEEHFDDSLVMLEVLEACLDRFIDGTTLVIQKESLGL